MKFTDHHTAPFEQHRDLLTGIAYRMLGSTADAEDMVQEAWLRWSRSDPAAVASVRSWLVTIVSRLCLDRLKSAQAQREHYFGIWLPEPYVDPVATATAEVDESVSIALLMVLEKLSPIERAGFLLHDVFGHTFEEISVILEQPAVNCRKMVSRARERVRAEKPRFTTTPQEHEDLLSRFMEASRYGELEPLMDLLADSVTLQSDGGGKASAVRWVLGDRRKIAQFFIGVAQHRDKKPAAFQCRFVTFNGAPGMVIEVDGQPTTALSLEIRDGKIATIYSHRNPDKLAAFRLG